MRWLVVGVASASLLFVAPAQSLAAVGDTPSATYPGFDNTVWAIAHRGNTIYVGGEFKNVTDSHGTSFERNGAAAVDARTGTVLPWNPNVDGVVFSILATKRAVFLGGRFAAVHGEKHRNIARVSGTGAGAPRGRFRVAVSDRVSTLAKVRGRVLLGGDFTRVNGRPRLRIAAFADRFPFHLTDWRPRAQGGVVERLVSTRSGVFVAGGFRKFNGDRKRQRLVLVSQKSGKVVRSFRPSVGAKVLDIAVGDKRVYAAVGGLGGHVFSFDRRTGQARWSHWLDGDAQAISLVGRTVYVGGHFNRACDDPSSGRRETCRGGAWWDRRRGVSFDVSGTISQWNPDGNSVWGVRVLHFVPGIQALVAGGHVTSWSNGSIKANRFAVFTDDST